MNQHSKTLWPEIPSNPSHLPACILEVRGIYLRYIPIHLQIRGFSKTTKHVCNQIKGAVLIWFQISTLVPFGCELQQVVKKCRHLYLCEKGHLFQCGKQHVFGKTNVNSVYISNAPTRKTWWFVIYIYIANHVIFHGKVNTWSPTMHMQIYTLYRLYHTSILIQLPSLKRTVRPWK